MAVATFTKRKLVKRRRGSEARRTSSGGSARGGTCGSSAGHHACSGLPEGRRDVDDLVTNIDQDWGGARFALAAIQCETAGNHAAAADGDRRERGPAPLPLRPLCWNSSARSPDDLRMPSSAETADGAERLAARDLQLIHDSGVERLLMKVSESQESRRTSGQLQRPRKNGYYGPTELPGIAALRWTMRDASPTGDDESARCRGAVPSRLARTAAPRRNLERLGQPSSRNATVRSLGETRSGWRTLGLWCDGGRVSTMASTTPESRPLLAEAPRTAAICSSRRYRVDRPLRFLHFGHGAGVLRATAQDLLGPGSDHVSVDLDGAVLDVSAFEAPHAGRAVQSRRA